ncbi:hypothetical protein HXX76_000842 [Chlamydomonas incerta]|uniref:LIM zinc-binding domain-containing protein n=1 Tax=Chlamydomonas incerta TaxID=51695 RepID=A0A835WFP9_CHLIN|nr:hypothetical protein HXX76_000842 [Chlamydomonas incerta]|eukprot:KAG2446250.1 hypothetical protein HXX76_000842 [Chlamydomonas incerta]
MGGFGGSASSAPASPKGAAAAAAAGSAGGSFSSRHGSPSSRARQGYPAASGPSSSSSSQQQPAQQRPLPPVGRSKSATGPNGLMGVGAASGSGGSASGAAAAGGQRPALPPPPTLYSDPDACAGCGKGFGGVLGAVLGLGGGSGYVTGMNRKWHPDCFKCGFCTEPISSGRGSFSYQMHPGDPRPYHPDCYKHVHHPVCTVCGTFIPADRDGRIAFKEAGFWRERYCHGHAEADIVRCCACSRLQKKGEEWAPLPDGRPLCLGCLGSVCLDTADAQPLYGELMDWYRADMRLPHTGGKPPLLLVDGPTLNEHAAREGRDDSAGAPVFHVRGLCVATVYTSIPTIRRGNGGALQTIATALSQSAAAALGGGSVRCDVKCILLLYGLPRLLTGSIMAHELMHAWLRQAGCVGLPLKVEEGLCQLMACLWLDRQHELLAGSPDEQRLASFFSYQIRTDTSEVYGDGFREAMEAFQTHGLTNVVRNVQLYGRFTPP